MIQYKELYSYRNKIDESTKWDANITTFNMNAWTAWHEMNAKEDYWLAW